MKTEPVENIQPPEVEPARSVLCPGCGYDLRATASDRCSECGLVLDREALQRSGFPWAHRKEIGQLRAFLKTVWLVTVDSKTLRYESAKTQSPRDAAGFRRWVAVVLAVCFAGAVVMLIRVDAIADIAVANYSAFSPYAGSPMQDLLVPWSAGITIRPALFLYAFGLAAYVAGATRPIFRAREMPDDYQQATEAMGGYVVAPLTWLLLAAFVYAAVLGLRAQEGHILSYPPFPIYLTIATIILAILAIGGTVYRTGQWRARTVYAGYPTGFLGMGELLIRWVAGFVVLLGVVPWCLGFVWMVIDSSLD